MIECENIYAKTYKDSIINLIEDKFSFEKKKLKGFDLNDFKSAVSSYENAIKINPKHAGAHHNLAITLKEGGFFDKSIKSHSLAIKHEPENLAHYHFLSELKEDILNLG